MGTIFYCKKKAQQFVWGHYFWKDRLMSFFHLKNHKLISVNVHHTEMEADVNSRYLRTLAYKTRTICMTGYQWGKWKNIYLV